MQELLNLINSWLSITLGLNYEFGQMSESPPSYPYWVGDYKETEGLTEDGVENYTVILSGFSRGTYFEFETQKSSIESFFKFGQEQIVQPLSTGNGETKVLVTVHFGDSTNILNDEEDMDLKRCEIHLQSKIWKGYD